MQVASVIVGLLKAKLKMTTFPSQSSVTYSFSNNYELCKKIIKSQFFVRLFISNTTDLESMPSF